MEVEASFFCDVLRYLTAIPAFAGMAAGFFILIG